MHVWWSNVLVAMALLAVLLVLLAGIANLSRGGSSRLSQLLMRWRVGLQALAIIIILVVLYFRR